MLSNKKERPEVRSTQIKTNEFIDHVLCVDVCMFEQNRLQIGDNLTNELLSEHMAMHGASQVLSRVFFFVAAFASVALLTDATMKYMCLCLVEMVSSKV